MKYLIGGIVITSAIEFDQLPCTDNDPDFHVFYGDVPDKLSDVEVNNGLASVNSKGDVLFVMPEIARYLITSDEVIIQLYDESRASDAKKYILTFVLGVMSFKKGYFPLHGGGIMHNNEAYLFTGQQGAGKSTTISALSKLGFATLGDDISNLFVKDGLVYVHPCFPYFKLWDSTIDLLEITPDELVRLRSDMDKFLVPMPNFSNTPVKLKRIYFLYEHDQYSFTEIGGKKKIMKLKKNSYRTWLVDALKLSNIHFSLLNEIASNVECVFYRRPMTQATFTKSIQLLKENIQRT